MGGRPGHRAMLDRPQEGAAGSPVARERIMRGPPRGKQVDSTLGMQPQLGEEGSRGSSGRRGAGKSAPVEGCHARKRRDKARIPRPLSEAEKRAKVEG